MRATGSPHRRCNVRPSSYASPPAGSTAPCVANPSETADRGKIRVEVSKMRNRCI
ncbi:hypothetical protein EPIB1_658 [Tritonibacter mobilis]|nr:hypothetical protein EPIB1_658 [Tritonibacter mobilis]